MIDDSTEMNESQQNKMIYGRLVHYILTITYWFINMRSNFYELMTEIRVREKQILSQLFCHIMPNITRDVPLEPYFSFNAKMLIIHN